MSLKLFAVIELSNCHSVISEASDLWFGVSFHLSQVTYFRLDPEWNLECGALEAQGQKNGKECSAGPRILSL